MATKTRPRPSLSSALNNTTTPAGIAANDPEAVKGVRFRGDIGGPKCSPNEHGLIIDAEIRDLIEPLTPHERGTLKANMERDGCLDPLKGWKETGILLDGHNRKEISEAHTPDPIPFAVEWLSFPDRQSAIAWVLGNQLGRRNITDEHRAYLIGKRLEHESQPRGGDRKSKVQNEPLNGDTAARIAKETGKSRATVKRNGVFSKAVDKLANGRPALRKRLLDGSVKMSPAAAKAVVKFQPAKIRATVERIENGVPNVDAVLGPAARETKTPKRETKPAKGETGRGIGETEFRETVLNRLREIQSLTHNFKADLKPVRQRVLELLSFVEAWQ